MENLRASRTELRYPASLISLDFRRGRPAGWRTHGVVCHVCNQCDQRLWVGRRVPHTWWIVPCVRSGMLKSKRLQPRWSARFPVLRWSLAYIKIDVCATLPQVTTDGFRAYISAIDDTLGADCSYAVLIKSFGSSGEVAAPEGYHPPRVVGVFHEVMFGQPEPEHISMSYVERQNLTMRMALRRFARLTNAFSKSLLHLKAALSLHFAWYDFVRVHQSLRITPAMQAGISRHIWNLGELLA
jgi:hypothetical protein